MKRSLLALVLVACGTDPTVQEDVASYAQEACEPRTDVANELALGVAHAAGTYPELQAGESFLQVGAERLQTLGVRSIKLMLTNDYQKRYPEQFPEGITDLAALAATDNFARVLGGSFETYSILTYTFALGVNDPWRSQPSDELLAREKQEIQELTEYLLTTYAHTGKTFILHNWESDWPLRAGDVTDKETLQLRSDRMVAWLNARQAGVNAARAKIGERGVRVLHSVEVNKVLSTDDTLRAVDSVLPRICPDMVSYSAYEAIDVRRHMPQAEAEAQITANLKSAFTAIRAATKKPTPIYLSEFGFPETEYQDIKSTLDVSKMIEHVIEVARDERLAGAFYWQVFDNECTGQGTGCRGFWVVRPDGSLSTAGETLRRVAASPARYLQR